MTFQIILAAGGEAAFCKHHHLTTAWFFEKTNSSNSGKPWILKRRWFKFTCAANGAESLMDVPHIYALNFSEMEFTRRSA